MRQRYEKFDQRRRASSPSLSARPEIWDLTSGEPPTVFLPGSAHCGRGARWHRQTRGLRASGEIAGWTRPFRSNRSFGRRAAQYLCWVLVVCVVLAMPQKALIVMAFWEVATAAVDLLHSGWIRYVAPTPEVPLICR